METISLTVADIENIAGYKAAVNHPNPQEASVVLYCTIDISGSSCEVP